MAASRVAGAESITAVGGVSAPRLPSEIKEMTDIEAAQVGRMIDTDGWVTRSQQRGPLNWVIGFYAATLPQLAYDLQKLTGGGSVSNLRKGKQWYVSRFRSVMDLLTRIAPWSYKAQAALETIHRL